MDGELPLEGPDGARAMEERLAADPARARRLEALREATDLWRDEARRTARDLGGSRALATRVLERVRTPAPRVSAPYRIPAAAAVLLIAAGAVGTFLVRRPEPRPQIERNLKLEDLERAQVDLVAELAIGG